jgi:hypothetical protein
MTTTRENSAPALRPLSKMLTGFALSWTFIVATPALFAQEAASTAEATAATATATAAPAEKPKIHEVIAASDPYVQAFNEHLTILASPWMEGRLPGTRGMERAMDYMEDEFRKAGLLPAFQPSDGGPKNYRQPFSLGSQRDVTDEQVKMLCGGNEIALEKEKDFRFTSLGAGGSAEGVLAFVGYGIEDGPDGYTSFAEGHSLEGKIALVLRFEPMDDKGNSQWSGGEGWSGRAGFQGKIAAIAKRNPAAIVVVNTPGANDPRITSLGTGGGGRAMADVPIFMVSTDAGERLVAACDGEKRSLMDLRKLADAKDATGARSFDLAGSKVAVSAVLAAVGRSLIGDTVVVSVTAFELSE